MKAIGEERKYTVCPPEGESHCFICSEEE